MLRDAYSRRKEYLAAGVIAAGILSLYWRFTPKLVPGSRDYSKGWDHHVYIELAQEPFVVQCPSEPQCFRVLQPWIIGILPTPLQSTFLAFTITALIIASVGIYAFLRELDIEWQWSLVGMAMFLHLSGAVRFLVWDFWLSDAVGLAIIAIGLWAIVSNRSRLIVALVLPGVLIREPVIFLIPVWFLWQIHESRAIDRDLIIKGVAFSIVGAIVLLAPRLVLSDGGYSLHSQLAKFGPLARLENPSDDLQRYTIYSWGILVFLPLLAARRVGKNVWPFLPLVLLGILQTFIGGSIERYQMVFAPVMIYAAILGFRRADSVVRNQLSTYSAPPVLYIFPFLAISIVQVAKGSRKYGMGFDLQIAIISMAVLGMVCLGGLHWLWNHYGLTRKLPFN